MHIVRNYHVSEATSLLREMVVLADGVKPVATALGVPRDEVVEWIQDGIPKDRVSQIASLEGKFSGVAGNMQNPNYCTNQPFTVQRSR